MIHVPVSIPTQFVPGYTIPVNVPGYRPVLNTRTGKSNLGSGAVFSIAIVLVWNTYDFRLLQYYYY